MDCKGNWKQLQSYIYWLYLGISLDWLNTTMRNLKLDSQCFGHDSNPVISNCNPGVRQIKSISSLPHTLILNPKSFMWEGNVRCLVHKSPLVVHYLVLLNSVSPSKFKQLSLAACWFECVGTVNTSRPTVCSITVRKSIYYKPHIDEFWTVLLQTGGYRKDKQLFYATVQPWWWDLRDETCVSKKKVCICWLKLC
jgi:hypothetical protein